MIVGRFIAASLIFAGLAGSASGQQLNGDVLSRVKKSTVFLKVTLSNGEISQGSGFLVKKDLLVTNAHVLGMVRKGALPPKSVQAVFQSGDADEEWIVTAELVGCDRKSDLAFLSIDVDDEVTPLALAKGKTIRETTPVFIVGFPFGDALAGNGKNPSVTIGNGTVSSLRRNGSGVLESIQINGDLNPGNSGGPIILRNGEAMAVSVATILGTQISFAIPVEDVSRLLNSGGISDIAFANVKKNDATYSCDLDVSAIDPCKRHKSLTIRFWNVSSKTDGKRGLVKEVKLTRNEKATWAGKVSDLTVSPEVTLYHDVMATLTNGKQVVVAVAQAVPTATFGIKSKAITTKAIQKPTPKVSAKRKPRAHETTEIITPVTPKNATVIKAEMKRDEKGRQFVFAEIAAEKKPLSGKIICWACPPSGREVYVTFVNKTGIHVFNPATMEKIGMIPTPRYPSHFYCDETRIVVTCPGSNVVTVFDSKKRRPITAFKMRDRPKLIPQMVLGRDPDGAYLVTWKAKKHARWDQELYRMSEDGKVAMLKKATIGWGAYLPDGNYFFAQDNFRGSPSGGGELFDFGNGGKTVNLYKNHLFGSRAGFHRSFTHTFTTHDNRHFVMPTRRLGDRFGYQPWTYVVDGCLERIVVDFPGTALLEIPHKKIFVSYGQTYDAKRKESGPTIYYSARSTGRVMRKIKLTGFSPHPAYFINVDKMINRIFVPGHERFLYMDRSHSGKNTTVLSFKCGPVETTLEIAADPVIAVKNEPPTKTEPTKTVTFKPDFKALKGKTVTYKLKETLNGMTINSTTGEWSWTPSPAWIGDYQITILAEVDGVDIEVISWMMTVD